MSENVVESGESAASRRIVAVRFVPVGKLYHFDATAHPDVQPGDRVVVETTRGRQVGEVVCFVEPGPGVQKEPDGTNKPIERLATPRELAMQQCWKAKEEEALAAARQRAHRIAVVGCHGSSGPASARRGQARRLTAHQFADPVWP